MNTASLARRVVAEGLGTALLLAAVVGSGVMAERLAAGNVALALLANTIATGTALVAILLALAPISGAHLNPAVTIVAAWGRALAWVDVPGYVGAQVLGAFAGVGLAHLMYGLPVFELSHHARDASGQLVSEFVATFGLVLVIWSCARFRTAAVPFAVGAYVTAAYWFTASTSFANPAVAAARLATNTFTGIRPHDVPGFVGAELLGAGSAAVLARWLVAAESPEVHP